jgi:hypothetical protein
MSTSKKKENEEKQRTENRNGRDPIAFLRVVGSVHHALEVDAVGEAVQVGDLVGQDVKAAAVEERHRGQRSFLVEMKNGP